VFGTPSHTPSFPTDSNSSSRIQVSFTPVFSSLPPHFHLHNRRFIESPPTNPSAARASPAVVAELLHHAALHRIEAQTDPPCS
jgi:hypothetical protein